jgi:CRP/FNR family cyclic AMP-dependent transcriptional regulator
MGGNVEMTNHVVLQALKDIDFTKDLEPTQLERLASISTFVTFTEETTIFRESDTSDLVYLITEGEVSLLTQVPGHGQVTILTIGPGQLLGWSSLFQPKKKTAGARTNMPTKAVAINALQLLELCQNDNTLGFRIMWNVADVISDRLRAARTQLLDMFEPSRTSN